MQQDPSKINFSFVLASAVHDMKNSLSMLLSSLGDLMHTYPPQTQEQHKTYASLEYEAARINSDLIQLLSLYRLENDKFHVQIDEHFAIDLLKEQLARNHVLLETRSLEVELECDPDLQGYFDADLLGGVINNVLVNGARYSKQRMRVGARKFEQGLIIFVEDDGPGFPQEMLSFSDWVDSHSSYADGRPHLGLFFAYKVAALHESKTGRGSMKLSNNSRLGGGIFELFIP